MPRRPYRAKGSAAPRTAAACVVVSTVTRARLSDTTHSQPSTTITPASKARRATAVAGCPSEASRIACAARPGGIQRSQLSTPAKLAAVSFPSAVSRGTICTKASYRAKTGRMSRAARSRPRRERSSPARAVVTNRASVMQNSTCSSTASTAISTPTPPWASPTVTPSRPITLASGQMPVAEAASSPTASGRRRSGNRASVAGSRVPSRPKAISGTISQPNANTVKITVVRSTDALLPCRLARVTKTPAATSTAATELVMKAALAPVDARSALRSRRSFSWTRSRATTVPPRRSPAGRPGR